MKRLLGVLYDFMHKPWHPYKVIRHWMWKRRVNRALRILDELDWHLKSRNLPRYERRRLWEQFHHNPNARTAILNKITQE